MIGSEQKGSSGDHGCVEKPPICLGAGSDPVNVSLRRCYLSWFLKKMKDKHWLLNASAWK
jgi:hypothetical protein